MSATTDSAKGVESWPVLQPSARRELPAGWAGNSINTAIYRSAGLVTHGQYQFGAYYRSGSEMVVFRRSLAEEGRLETAIIRVRANVKDAHNVACMGCDRDGYLHLTLNHHNSKLHYIQSKAPHDIGRWTGPLAMTGQHESQITYPCFLSPTCSGQPLLFLYRSGKASSGDVFLKQFDVGRRCWVDTPSAILDGSNARPWSSSPYINHPIIGRDGRLHLFYTWRTKLVGSDRVVNNHNVDYAVSDDWGSTWNASDGIPLPLPLSPVMGETVLGTGPGNGLINQCGAYANSSGSPFSVHYLSEAGKACIKLIWWDRGGWRTRSLPGHHEEIPLRGSGTLKLPISRPDVILDRLDRLWVLLRKGMSPSRLVAMRLDPPEYDRVAIRACVLWDTDLGAGEPVIDRARLVLDGVLSAFLQCTEQQDHEGTANHRKSPVWLADWDIDAVDEGLGCALTGRTGEHG